MSSWIQKYDRRHRPGLPELSEHLPPETLALFMTFSSHLARAYHIHCAPATYSATRGWVYRFGRSGMYLLSNVYITDDAFHVGNIAVRSDASLLEALALADAEYRSGFPERLAAFSEARAQRQKDATRRRLAREQGELAAMQALINPERFNRFRWSPKISRTKLARLYERDAIGLPDEALADEIGISLYIRCLQGQEERDLIEVGKLRCHHCGEVLPYAKDLIVCPCGDQYQFREYMRSFRKNNMPSGSATHIFRAFIDAWPKANTYAKKMALIDGLVHEFHINLVTGVKGRFVGINLIEGTKKQIEALILSLAYADARLASKQQFEQHLKRL